MTRAKLIHRIAMGSMLIVTGASSGGCGMSMDFSDSILHSTYKPKPSPPRPSLSAPFRVRAVQGYLLTVEVTATDADSLDVDLSGLPADNDASFVEDAGRLHKHLQWTPTASDSGPYYVEFVAMNAYYTARIKTAICVTDHVDDAAPIITAPAEVAATTQTTFHVRPSAADPDGDPIFSWGYKTEGINYYVYLDMDSDPPHEVADLVCWSFYPDTFDVTFRATNFLTATATTRVMVTAPEASASQRVEATTGSLAWRRTP